MIRRHRLSAFPAVASILLIACGGATSDAPATGTDHTITAATLDSLPVVAPDTGRVVCIGDGKAACPLGGAIANWLAPDRFAVWEPGRRIWAWKVGDSTGVLIGDFGPGDGQYTNPGAVGSNASGEVLVLDADASKLIRYSADGKFVEKKSMPALSGGLIAWGFGGRTPVIQTISSNSPQTPAEMVLKLLDAPGDTVGKVGLRVTLPWLRLSGATVAAPLPLFPTQPVYAVGDDKSIVWSSAERFWLRRIGADGKIEWTLVSDVVGAPIDTAAITSRKKLLAESGVVQIDIDSMVAKTPATHAAISGILMNRSGALVVARSVVPGSDSVSYVMVSSAGVPTARFALPRAVHPLLLTGDSLLVQRPTEGEPLEIRWLVLTKKP